MFIKARNYLVPNFTTEDFRVQVRGPLANYVYGCHVTPATRGGLGYIAYQKGIIQAHLVHRYVPRKATVLCFKIVFWAVLSLHISTQTVFRKVYFEALFLMFLVSMLRIGCYVKQMKSIPILKLPSVIYMGAKVNLVPLLIFIDWYKHSNTKVPSAF